MRNVSVFLFHSRALPASIQPSEVGPVKWAVLREGDLVVQPKFVDGREISHAVLSQGAPVRAAGEAEIAGNSLYYFGMDINNHSGHFQPSAESVQVGRHAFEQAGISFP